MRHYRFLTTWLLEASRRAAWEVLQDPAGWPEWWRGVVRVSELDAGGAGRVGSRYRRWMNALRPIARPVFEYNHDVVMRWGGEGLARRLGAKLLAAG